MLVCQKADGEAASAKLNTLTHAYYVGILKAHIPAIYHGQGLGRGDRCGLRLKARVRKVNNQTPRRKKSTLFKTLSDNFRSAEFSRHISETE